MKSPLTILKFALLALLLIGLAIGFIFFRVWQKNERPTLTESSWKQSEISIGHSAQLSISISAPWHREITRATPLSYPAFLIPIADKATFRKGSLALSGKRTWYLEVPFVATDTKSLDGLTATFPIKSTKRVSPNALTLALPQLTVISPSNLPDEPHNPQDFLSEEKPEPEPEVIAESEEKKNPWLWALLALLLLPLLYFVLKRSGVIKTTPAWEKALAKLDQLDPKSQPIAFYSKLTDILKQYTAERYSVRARSKTSAEFIQILRHNSQAPIDKVDDLRAYAQLADAVKFADHRPDETEAPKSLALVRSFVKDTTPQPDSTDV